MIEAITNNWVEIMAAATAAVVALDKIVKLTPWTQDDDMVDALKSLLGIFRK